MSAFMDWIEGRVGGRVRARTIPGDHVVGVVEEVDREAGAFLVADDRGYTIWVTRAGLAWIEPDKRRLTGRSKA